MFNGTSYLYKVPNLPSFTAKYPFRQLDLLISNLSTQPTHFASCQLNPPSFFYVDMFPLTANFLFFGRVALCPKSTPSQESLVFKPFSYIYFSTFDINTTHSTWHERTGSTSFARRFVRLDPLLFLLSRS